MLFLLVIVTFAACLFGVVAIEISLRKREEREGSGEDVARLQGPVAAAFGGRSRPPAPATPPSGERGSRAA